MASLPTDKPIGREDAALDALIVWAFLGKPLHSIPVMGDDPAILTEADRMALEDLGEDLVDRLLAAQQREGGR